MNSLKRFERHTFTLFDGHLQGPLLMQSFVVCVFFLFYPLEPTTKHEILFHLGQSYWVPWSLENLTFWWGWTRVNQEVLQPKTKQGEDGEGGAGRERACCLVSPMRQQQNKRLTQWGGQYWCEKTTSRSASEPKACLDNPRRSKKQEGGQSLKDVFILFLCFFFSAGGWGSLF